MHTRGELAKLLGRSEASIDRLIRAGLKPVGSRGRAKTYSLETARDMLARPAPDRAARSAYFHAQARRMEAKAELQELETARIRGELIHPQRWADFLIEHITEARGILLGIPTMIRRECGPEAEPRVMARIVAVAERAVRQALEHLSTGAG
jgi:phage terminase Nu1 subunit (DNA packaging protein)